MSVERSGKNTRKGQTQCSLVCTLRVFDSVSHTPQLTACKLVRLLFKRLRTLATPDLLRLTDSWRPAISTRLPPIRFILFIFGLMISSHTHFGISIVRNRISRQNSVRNAIYHISFTCPAHHTTRFNSSRYEVCQ